ncbi:hypothetical protein D3C85_1106490 [compost metagenome]
MQVVDHPQHREFADRKLAAVGSLNIANHHGDAVFSQHLSHFAACAKTRIAFELILFRPEHGEGENIFRRAFRQGKGGDFHSVVLTAHQAVPACTKHREGIFGDGDIQVEIVNSFAQHHT